MALGELQSRWQDPFQGTCYCPHSSSHFCNHDKVDCCAGALYGGSLLTVSRIHQRANVCQPLWVRIPGPVHEPDRGKPCHYILAVLRLKCSEAPSGGGLVPSCGYQEHSRSFREHSPTLVQPKRHLLILLTSSTMIKSTPSETVVSSERRSAYL